MTRTGAKPARTVAVLAFALSAGCGGGGGGAGVPSSVSGPAGAPAPAIAVNPEPASAAIYCDPGNKNGAQSGGRSSESFIGETHRRPVALAAAMVPGVVNVTYGRAAFLANRALTASDLDFKAVGRVTRILHVPAGTEDAAVARLKTDPAVISAGRSVYRYVQSAAPSYTNDPFELGSAPANQPPFYEQPATEGQWDLHVVCAPHAWGYAKAGNGTGQIHAGAAGGGSAYPIAIIDTGADLTHPDLQPAGRVVYAEQIVGGVVHSGVAAMHDDDGHGTNVTGIAAASANNNLGFAGVAYNAPLMIFNVFPDPPCSGGQCAASSADIAVAINDAVAHGAKIISMSLGSDAPADDEETAVENAIAADVVVVAAAGNGNPTTGFGNPALSYPAADPGVIAVGSSAIDDSNPATPNLKVASYSNYVAGSLTWGVLAPGGDACPGALQGKTCGDVDNLHWVENIYSSTAVGTGRNCMPDVGGTEPDCRALMIGTSQAAPHVAGAVALLLSVGVPQNPATIRTLLCQSAKPLLPSAVNAGHQGCGELDVYRAMAAALGDRSYP